MNRMSLQRQTYLVMGILIWAGLALGIWVEGWFLLLPALLALGMVGAAARGNCTMMRMLSHLPGNPPHSGDIT